MRASIKPLKDVWRPLSLPDFYKVRCGIFLSRSLEPAALACGGYGHVKDSLADAQVAADPFVDFCVVASNLFLFHTGPGRSPTGAGVSFFMGFSFVVSVPFFFRGGGGCQSV